MISFAALPTVTSGYCISACSAITFHRSIRCGYFRQTSLVMPARFASFIEAGCARNIEFDLVAADGSSISTLFSGTAEYDADGRWISW